MQLPSLPAISASLQNHNSEMFNALSSVVPAVASTACCWGPAALSLFGAAGSSSSALFSQISKFRPHLLAVSACMISYSFYKVYGPPSQQEHACCKTPEEKARHAKSLRISRMVAWASLGVAVVGASYGRVTMPKSVLAPFAKETPKFPNVGIMGAAKNNLATPQSLKLQVEGMHCGGCANRIQKAIENIGGIQKAMVDYETGSVVVKGTQGGLNEEAIKAAVSKLGYIVAGN
jgi:copper chaperone CopZ